MRRPFGESRPDLVEMTETSRLVPDGHDQPGGFDRRGQTNGRLGVVSRQWLLDQERDASLDEERARGRGAIRWDGHERDVRLDRVEHLDRIRERPTAPGGGCVSAASELRDVIPTTSVRPSRASASWWTPRSSRRR